MDYVPESTGSIDEVVVVTEESDWKGEIGDKLRDVFMETYPVLPQNEPLFDLRQVTGKGFMDLFKKSGLIIIAGTLGEKNETTQHIQQQLNRITESGKTAPAYFVRNDVWSKPQNIIYLYGKNKAELLQKIENNKERMTGKLSELGEKRALRSLYVSGEDDGLTKLMKDKFKLDFKVPKSFLKVLEEKIWYGFGMTNKRRKK